MNHKAYSEAIDSILMICMAYDYSPENDGEDTLRKIRNIAERELVIHR